MTAYPSAIFVFAIHEYRATFAARQSFPPYRGSPAVILQRNFGNCDMEHCDDQIEWSEMEERINAASQSPSWLCCNCGSPWHSLDYQLLQTATGFPDLFGDTHSTTADQSSHLEWRAMDVWILEALDRQLGILTKTAPQSPLSFRVEMKLTSSQLIPLRNQDPVVFLCASAAWGITTVYLLGRYSHNRYQNHFLVAGISISVLLAALTLVIDELPSYLAITYAPLWISFVILSSTMTHWLLFGTDQEVSARCCGGKGFP